MSSLRVDRLVDTMIWDRSKDSLVSNGIHESTTNGTSSSLLNFDEDFTALSPSWALAWPEVPPVEEDLQLLELPLSELEINNTVSRYLYQIHPSMPFFSASFLLDGLKSFRHRTDQEFAAMIIALCAFTYAHSRDANVRLSAADFISQALRMHQGPDLGELPTVESLLTSMFISGALWRVGKNSAAWLRLQETINLARLLHLHNLEHDSTNDLKFWDNKARIYLGLSVIDRFVS